MVPTLLFGACAGKVRRRAGSWRLKQPPDLHECLFQSQKRRLCGTPCKKLAVCDLPNLVLSPCVGPRKVLKRTPRPAKEVNREDDWELHSLV
jgi:hypothetical protein